MKLKSQPVYQHSLMVFLQFIIVLIGLGTLTFLLWEPHLEGRNQDATWFQVYFNDPLLLYVYTGSIALFVALYSAFRLLGDAAHGKIPPKRTLHTLKTIKICMIIIACFSLGFKIYIHIVQRSIEEDIAGGAMISLLVFLSAVTAAVLASIFMRALQSVKNSR